MTIEDISTKHVQIVTPDTPLDEVAQLMSDHDCGSVLVRDGDKLAGIITDRDIVLRCVAKSQDPVTMLADQCLTPEILYCFEDDQAEEILRNMANNRIRRMIVLDNPQDKQLVGIVSFGDLSAACKDKGVSGKAMEEIRMAA